MIYWCFYWIRQPERPLYQRSTNFMSYRMTQISPMNVTHVVVMLARPPFPNHPFSPVFPSSFFSRARVTDLCIFYSCVTVWVGIVSRVSLRLRPIKVPTRWWNNIAQRVGTGVCCGSSKNSIGVQQEAKQQQMKTVQWCSSNMASRQLHQLDTVQLSL